MPLKAGQSTFYLAESGHTSSAETSSRRTSVASSIDSWSTCDEDQVGGAKTAAVAGPTSLIGSLAAARVTGSSSTSSDAVASPSNAARPLQARPNRGQSSTSSSNRTSVTSYLSAHSLAEESHGPRPSPAASPRRSRPGAYKRASVASVLSGYSVPEEVADPAGADHSESETKALRIPQCDSPLKSSPLSPDGTGSRLSSVAFPTTDSRSTSPTPSGPTSTASSFGPTGPTSPLGRQARSTAVRSLYASPSKFSRTVSFPSLAHPNHPGGGQQHGLLPPSLPSGPLVATSVSTFLGNGVYDESTSLKRSLSQSPSMLNPRTPVRAKTISLTGRADGGPGGQRWNYGGREGKTKAKDRGLEHTDDEQALKRREKKRKVVGEIVESERVYVEGLGIVIEHFMQPLLASAELPNPLLPKKIVIEIFSSIGDVRSFSTEFLAALEAEVRPPVNKAAASSPTTATPKAKVVSGLEGLHSTPRAADWIGSLETLASIAGATKDLDSLSSRISTQPASLPAFGLPSPSSEPAGIPGSVKSPDGSTPCPAQIINASSVASSSAAPLIVNVLAKHMPFLSLYHPFISAYPSSSALLARLRKQRGHERFAQWLAEREASDVCRRLRLGDWLLSVVQRVPRYLLLIKDLVSCTPEDDPEHDELHKVMAQVDNVTTTLNSRLHDIAATQQLIGLHRSFNNIPAGFSFVVPGRRLLKQGGLSKVCRRKDEDRTFWLFSDLVVYGTTASSASLTASKSMVSLSTWMGLPSFPSRSTSLDLGGPARPFATTTTAVPMPKSAAEIDVQGDKGRFTFHRAIRLEELTVVSTGDGRKKEHSFELLSPEKSFAVVASCQEEKDAWITAIREAKAQLLSDLRTLNTAEEHTMRRHRRRSLQAMPFPGPTRPILPSDVGGRSGPASSRRVSFDSAGARPVGEGPTTVESFIAAVWVPDTRAEKCMRCQDPFSVWRRRHHCRMCGLLCCHPCSSKSVQINDSTDPTSSAQGVRTCDSCFETLFPARRSSPADLASADPASSVSSSSQRPVSSHSSSTQSHDSPPTPTDTLTPLSPHAGDNDGNSRGGRLPLHVPGGGSRVVSGNRSGTAIDVQPPTPLDSPPSARPGKNTRSYFDNRARRGPDAAAALGTLKPSAPRTSILPLPRSTTAATMAATDDVFGESQLSACASPPSSALGTLKAKSPRRRSIDVDAAEAPTGRPSFARPPNQQRPRLLSSANDRFSVFVGGGAGGADWEGKGEMVKLTSERSRRESGERWGDASLRSGEAAGHLRRVLQGGS